MGYLSSSVMSRSRGGYGVRNARSRGGFPLIPIVGSWLGGALKRTAAGILRKSAPAVVGATVGAAIPGLVTGGAAPPGFAPVPGVKGKIQRFLPGGQSGFYKRRRMNPANPKALRRAIRRTDGFVKLARRTLKGTGFTIARRGFSKAAKTRKR
jgi:hypothetical protein